MSDVTLIHLFLGVPSSMSVTYWSLTGYWKIRALLMTSRYK